MLLAEQDSDVMSIMYIIKILWDLRAGVRFRYDKVLRACFIGARRDSSFTRVLKFAACQLEAEALTIG